MFVLAAYTLDLPRYACAGLRLLGPARTLAGRLALRWGAVSDGADYAIDASAMDGADAVLFQRYFPMEATWPLVEKALGAGIPVLYDTDDNFLDVPATHPMAARLAPVVPYARELLARADLVTVSTPELKRAFSGMARKVAVLPNFLDEKLWGGPLQQRREDTVRVVFAGTPSRLEDLEPLLPALDRVKARFGDGMELVFLGVDPGLARATVLPFQEDYAAYARSLMALAPDIGLAPLADTPFNRCKSPVKWLEYSAAGAAGLYAGLPPYAAVRHGMTGLVVEDGRWEEALTGLVEDSAARRRMAGAARGEVLARWGLEKGAEAYFTAWRRAVHAR